MAVGAAFRANSHDDLRRIWPPLTAVPSFNVNIAPSKNVELLTSVCLLLSEWITFFLVAAPPRSRRTFVELLIGCMLNPEG